MGNYRDDAVAVPGIVPGGVRYSLGFSPTSELRFKGGVLQQKYVNWFQRPGGELYSDGFKWIDVPSVPDEEKGAQ